MEKEKTDKGQIDNGHTKEEAADIRTSVDIIANMLYDVCVYTDPLIDCENQAAQRARPEDHDNHCG